MEIYIWLSYKYEKEFIERNKAREYKNNICDLIENMIAESNIEEKVKDKRNDSQNEDKVKFTRLAEES